MKTAIVLQFEATRASTRPTVFTRELESVEMRTVSSFSRMALVCHKSTLTPVLDASRRLTEWSPRFTQIRIWQQPGPEPGRSVPLLDYRSSPGTNCNINDTFVFEVSVENAEMMENCSWKWWYCIEKWPIILQFEVPLDIDPGLYVLSHRYVSMKLHHFQFENSWFGVALDWIWPILTQDCEQTWVLCDTSSCNIIGHFSIQNHHFSWATPLFLYFQ